MICSACYKSRENCYYRNNDCNGGNFHCMYCVQNFCKYHYDTHAHNTYYQQRNTSSSNDTYAHKGVQYDYNGRIVYDGKEANNFVHYTAF